MQTDTLTIVLISLEPLSHLLQGARRFCHSVKGALAYPSPPPLGRLVEEQAPLPLSKPGVGVSGHW